MKNLEIQISSIPAYTADSRPPIAELYKTFQKLTLYGWREAIVYMQNGFPVFCFHTPNQGPALWWIAGIHGEEPAGPCAIASNIYTFISLQKMGIPQVTFPLCNPSGYHHNKRYPNDLRLSVADANHLLLHPKTPTKPRRQNPATSEAAAITSKMIELCEKYPPLIVLDFHEDEDPHSKTLYTYSHAPSPIADKVVTILGANGINLTTSGHTRFGEVINHGIVTYEPYPHPQDGSIEEALAAGEIFFDEKKAQGPFCPHVVVIETPTVGPALGKRVRAHSEVINGGQLFWQMANR